MPFLRKSLLLLFGLSCASCPGADLSFAATNAASLHALTRVQMNRGRAFSLTGIITMADPQRDIFVLQDSSGPVLIHSDIQTAVTPGTVVALEARSGAPYVVNFPNFPFSPSGADIQMSFEAPTNWGDYHLTRMAGFVHPPETGDYTFWIASDNSSELWLSPGEDPKNARLIGSIRTGAWVNQREWSRYPSQRSDSIHLEAGRAYYIEAFCEQVELDEHLAVAWQGPGIKQSVIEGRYLTPWKTSTNGILREYWTNFTCGSLGAITSDRPAESGLSARSIRIGILATNTWPDPVQIDLGAQLSPENNYRWVQGEAQVTFLSTENGTLTLELKADQNRIIAHVPEWRGGLPVSGPNLAARVEGVCEGAYGPSGALMPGVIWAASDRCLKLFELPPTNAGSVALNAILPAITNRAMGGYFSARGVLTFNGRALGKDYLVVQDNNAGVFIVAPESPWAPASRLVVGDSVEIGGNLLPGRFAARLRPRVVNLVGQHTLPAPVLPGAESGPARYRDGQWTELEGVVRTVQPNGSLRLKRNDESIAVWLAKPITFSSSPRPDGAADDRSSGPSPSEEKAGGRRLPAAERDLLETLIDSAVRVRGVISLDTPESPLLLVPSSSFLQILEPARSNLEVRPISTLKLAAAKSDALHRVRVAGVVTYRDEKLLFVQDDSGGIRVQLDENAPVSVGDDLEVRGFPEPFVNSVPVLTDARATRLASTTTITPRPLDLNAPLRDLPNLALVRMKAHLVAQKNFENGQALEIQAGQRVFEALLSGGQQLPPLAPGSLLELTGVCALEIVPSTSSPHPGWDNSSIGAIRLLLRSPADVTLLKGAPWWSWKKAAFIIVVLVLLLAGTVLRGQILRRRFEKQQAARLAFARQLLENQESERRRIAANLHDTLGQNLLAIKNQAHLALQSTVDDEAVHRRLEDISSTVLNALEEVRQITHDLRPYQLDRLGLSQAIRALVRKSSDGGSIELASHVDNIDGVFPKETEMHIYRIVQEGINNVIKHSNATEAAVVLKAENSSLTISIRDNGRGLSQNGAGQEDFAPGFGLSGIRERAQIMNGRVEVEATAGNGFNLKVEIPIPSATGSTSKEHAIKAEVAHRG